MEGDRVAALIVQAAARGLVDFHEADILDRQWWLRLRFLLDDLERQNQIELCRTLHAHLLNALNRNTDQSKVQALWQRATSQVRTISHSLFPWMRTDEAAEAKAAMRELSDEWKRKFGDPKDPKIRIKIDRMARQWLEWNNRDTERVAVASGAAPPAE